MKKNCNLSVTRKSPEQGRQLELFQNLISKKPQIVSIPGASVKEKNRYRVVLAGEVFGDCLTIEQALKIAGGAK